MTSTYSRLFIQMVLLGPVLSRNGYLNKNNLMELAIKSGQIYKNILRLKY